MSIMILITFVWLLKESGVPGGPKHYSEVVEAAECLSSLKLFFYDFSKTPGMSGGTKHYPEVVKAPECFLSL